MMLSQPTKLINMTDNRMVKSVSFYSSAYVNEYLTHTAIKIKNKIEITFDESRLLTRDQVDLYIQNFHQYNLIIDEQYPITYVYFEDTNSEIIDNVKIFQNIRHELCQYLPPIYLDYTMLELNKFVFEDFINGFYVYKNTGKIIIFFLLNQTINVYEISYKGFERVVDINVFKYSDIIWVNHSSINSMNINNIHTDDDIESNNFQFTYLDGNEKAEDFITVLNHFVDINSKI